MVGAARLAGCWILPGLNNGSCLSRFLLLYTARARVLCYAGILHDTITVYCIIYRIKYTVPAGSVLFQKLVTYEIKEQDYTPQLNSLLEPQNFKDTGS
jgi:hypothetical protein